jgi:divalent metal cation (Fe/Co/Zn/Cd) transporter
MSSIDVRTQYVRQAIGLELCTIGYMVFEAVAALWIGFASRSTSLETFGLDSLIELVSGSILLWRLNVERRDHDPDRVEAVEQRASKIVGWSLIALAIYVVIQSASELIAQAKPEPNIWGILLAMASLILMPILARLKLRAADRIGSRALHADPFETIACAYLSGALLLGLAANYLFGWWWADTVAALAMLYFIVREAREALSGEHDE